MFCIGILIEPHEGEITASRSNHAWHPISSSKLFLRQDTVATLMWNSGVLGTEEEQGGGFASFIDLHSIPLLFIYII